VPGAALASHSRPSDMRGTQGVEIDGLVVVNKVTIDLRSRHDQTNAYVQGLWNPSTSSLTRGPWVPGAALASLRPSDAGHAGLEKVMVGCAVKVTIDLRSRHSTKRMHAVQGLWNPSTSSLTRGPLGAWGSLASHSRPSDMRARRAREIDGLVVRVKVT
jgi:hypothetical protein